MANNLNDLTAITPYLEDVQHNRAKADSTRYSTDVQLLLDLLASWQALYPTLDTEAQRAALPLHHDTLAALGYF